MCIRDSTENEVCERLGVSRTPVRQALFRMKQEGFVEVSFRAGWRVLPFDFDKFEQLYDLRMVLETEAVRVSAGRLGRRWRPLCAGAGRVATGPGGRFQRRTSRWKISRLCRLAATKLACDSVSTVRGRASP